MLLRHFCLAAARDWQDVVSVALEFLDRVGHERDGLSLDQEHGRELVEGGRNGSAQHGTVCARRQWSAIGRRPTYLAPKAKKSRSAWSGAAANDLGLGAVSSGGNTL